MNKFVSKILKSFFTLVVVIMTSPCFSQGAAINTTGAAADASAAFEVSSTTGGTLITRMTTSERNAISNPAVGLQIINTTTNCIEVYFSPMWQSVFCGCNPPSSPTAGTHIPAQTEIIWDWNSVSGATGYKYNTANNYGSATDNGTNTNFTQTFLTCNTSYTLYVWAYSTCGNSSATTLNQTTSSCFTCGVDNLVDSRDANNYQTVLIGTQCWMKENLKYLPIVHNNSEFATQATNSQPGYGVYGYDGNNVATAKSQANYTTYGVLYNWYAASGGTSSSSNPSGVQGVCPSGWHLPSDAEWKQLEMYLGMTQVEADATGYRGTNQGDQLKSTTLWTAGGTATNSSGFSALPGSYRGSGGSFYDLSKYGFWWSATEDGSDAWCRYLLYSNATVGRTMLDKGRGYAVRCLRD